MRAFVAGGFALAMGCTTVSAGISGTGEPTDGGASDATASGSGFSDATAPSDAIALSDATALDAGAIDPSTLTLPDCGATPLPDAGTVFADAGLPVVLASDQIKPWTIAIDDQNVYWTNHGPLGGVYKVPKIGGSVAPLFEGAIDFVESIGLDSTSVYFPIYEPLSIVAVPIAGGAVRTVATTSVSVRGVTVANGNVYWVEGPAKPNPPSSTAVAKKAPTSGGATTSLGSLKSFLGVGSGFMGSAADAVYAGLQPGGGLVRVPLDGTQPTTLFLGEIWGVTVDDTHVFFGGSYTIDSLAKSGGCPTHLAPAQEPQGVAVDDSTVYFIAGGNRRVEKVPKAGGPVTVLAQESTFGAHDIAVDATSIYWSNTGDGTIKKIAK